MTARKIPEKMYYSISEVSEITGLEPYVLRFWETEFPTLRPRKNKKGHRTYRKKDIEVILTIKELLYDNKYTIPGAREVLNDKRRAAASVKPRREPPRTKIAEDRELLDAIHHELTDLAALLDKEKSGDIFAE